jgi:single-strand DNA-binding protein
MPARGTSRTTTSKAKSEEVSDKVEYGEREDGSLSGNLTRDPELRFTQTGRPVTSFSVAVNERVKNEETGEWEDTEPEFFNCTAWGQQAENVAEYLGKGDRIVAVGFFQDRTFLNKRTNERQTVTEFTAKDIGPSMLWNGAKVIKAQRSSK